MCEFIYINIYVHLFIILAFLPPATDITRQLFGQLPLNVIFAQFCHFFFLLLPLGALLLGILIFHLSIANLSIFSAVWKYLEIVE